MTYLLCELDEHIVHISLHISLQHDFEQFVHHLMINVYYINQTKRHKPIIENINLCIKSRVNLVMKVHIYLVVSRVGFNKIYQLVL